MRREVGVLSSDGLSRRGRCCEEPLPLLFTLHAEPHSQSDRRPLNPSGASPVAQPDQSVIASRGKCNFGTPNCFVVSSHSSDRIKSQLR